MIPVITGLWQPSARDAATGLIEIWRRGLRSQGAAASFNLDLYVVPRDKVLLILSVCFFVTPGAGQRAGRQQLSIIDDEGLGAQFITWGDNPDPALPAAFPSCVTLQGLCYALPNRLVRATSTYDAGVAVNDTFVAAQGLLLARGQLELNPP